MQYNNYYHCEKCNINWQDQWDAMCNDRCPNCRSETEPYKSDEIINCYDCIYRGTVPGDAHSCCRHPFLEGTTDNPVDALFNLITNKDIFISAIHKLQIKANNHGILKGWFNWPVNFDPVWLENCKGFKENGN
jgi:hypothetical protein